MSLKERCHGILIVPAIDSLTPAIGVSLPESGYTPIHNATTINVAKRMTTERSYDLVITNSPLPDDIGTRSTIDTCTLKHTAVLLLVKADIHATIHDKVAEHGVLILSKPTSRAILIQALHWMESMRERLRQFEKESASIEEEVTEICIANKVKWLLISESKMSESDVHRYIEKQAMDQCIIKRSIAEDIIKTYSQISKVQSIVIFLLLDFFTMSS